MNRPSRSISSVCFVIMVFSMLVEFGCSSDNSRAILHVGGDAGSASANTNAAAPASAHRRSAAQWALASQTAPAAAPTLFPFLGNLTTLNAARPQAVALKRQADCSLLFAAFDYTLNPTTADFTINTAVTNYEKTLHDNAFLTTTPDVFSNGCVDSNVGYGPRVTVNLGLAKNGQIIGAAFNSHEIIWAGLNGDGSNSQPSTQAEDLPPITILNGDLNKDGNQDLVTINTNGLNGSIGVYLGTDAGGFGPETVITLPGEETGFGTIDDMNGDGKLDLVVGVGSGDQFQFLIYLGKGDGTFAAPVAYSPNQGNLDFFTPFVTADVNGDGHKDLVTTRGHVFLGQASGTSFTFKGVEFPPVTNASNLYAPGIVAADLNKDGKIDIAIDPGGSIQTFLGNGDGTFSVGLAYASTANRGIITATDLDGDGNMDLFSGWGNSGGYGGDDYVPNQAYALLGKGDGSFAGAPSLPIPYTGTNLLDLNGDGRPDLVGYVFNTTQNAMVTYLTGSDGIPVAGPQLTLASGLQVDSYATGALHTKSNSTPDLIFLDATTGGQLFHVYLGAGDGSFSSPTTFSLPTLVPTGFDINPVATGLRLGDFNGDGILDIAYSFQDEANDTQIYYEGLAVQLGTGDGTFAAPKITYTYQSSTAPTFAFSNSLSLVTDVNKDGFADAFLILPPATTGNPYTVQLFMGKGDGTFQSPNTLTVTPNVFVPTADGAYGTPFALADLNGDGKLDLVTGGSSADGTTPQFAISLGNGDGTFQAPAILLVEGFGYAGSPALADFDGDGKIDLYLAGTTEGSGLGIFPGSGDGTFKTVSNGDGTVSAPDVIALSLGGGSVAVDLNGDKVPDLIAGNVILINKSNATPPVTAATSTALTSSLNPSTVGASVTFTATVTSATAGTITGSVNFLDGSTSIGTGTVGTGGVATLMTSALAQGSHSITAVYGGDTNYTTSTSPVVSQVVNAAGGTAASSTTVTSSLNPSTVGTSVTFTATVVAAAPTGAKPSGAQATAATPTGTVTFKDGSTTLGTGTLASGSTTFATSALTQGTHSITAVYGGDTNYTTSASTAISQVVNAATSKAATTTALASSLNPSTTGTNVVFTATVTSTTAGTITGTVSFFDGSTLLRNATIGTGGRAIYQSTTLTQGTHVITAQYLGDSSTYATSTSTAVSQVVNAAAGKAATSTALSASSTNAVAGTNITFTATVTSSTAGTITGSVNFLDGGTQIGTGTVGAGGVATYQNSTLTAGSHSITASYGGDTNYATSTSTATQVTITSAGGSYTVASNPSTVTVSASAPATSQITVSPTGGFSAPVTFACTGAIAYSCSFSPATVTPNGGPASTTVTISAVSGSGVRRPGVAFASPSGKGTAGGATNGDTVALAVAHPFRFAIVFGGELLALALLASRRKRGLRLPATSASRLAYAVLLCAVAVTAMAGCSGGGGPVTNVLTVNATSGSTVVSTTITVNFSK